MNAVADHIGDTEYRFLKKAYNEIAFDTLVDEFLDKHGETYWGEGNRNHLEEMDPLKGFLYPRDVLRPGSR